MGCLGFSSQKALFTTLEMQTKVILLSMQSIYFAPQQFEVVFTSLAHTPKDIRFYNRITVAMAILVSIVFDLPSHFLNPS